MSTTTVPLDSEPSQPYERMDKHLPPKSYTAAVLEPATDGTNQSTNHHIDTHSKGSSQDLQPTSPSSAWTSGTRTPINEDADLYEKHIDGDGHVLTSLKPKEDYEASLRHDVAVAPRKRQTYENAPRKQDIPKSQLKTGRRAGAGWEQSA